MDNRIPFKYDLWLADKSLKLEIGRDDPWPARIVCWDFDGDKLIVAIKNPEGREEGLIYSRDGKHLAICPKIDSDLFILQEKEEGLSEFEKIVRFDISEVENGRYHSDDIDDVKGIAQALLYHAKKELLPHKVALYYYDGEDLHYIGSPALENPLDEGIGEYASKRGTPMIADCSMPNAAKHLSKRVEQYLKQECTRAELRAANEGLKKAL